jgi:hypothetical protein
MLQGLNYVVNKEAVTPSEPAGDNVQSGTAGRKSGRHVLVWGLIAGMAVGFLNLSAAVYGWKLKALFDVLDFPFTLPMWIASNWAPFPGKIIEIDMTYFLVAIVCYWPAVGLLMASLFCVLRKLARAARGILAPQKQLPRMGAGN